MGVPGLSGAVLAGGTGRRMGRSKSTLPLGGEALLQRQLRLLSEAGVTERWVSLGWGGVLDVSVESDVGLVRDDQPGQGPMGGVERVLAAAGHSRVLILAVDLPAMSAAFLRGLVTQCRVDRGVVPRLGGQFEPLAAIYPRSAGALAAARRAGGDLSLQGWVSELVGNDTLEVHRVAPADAPLFLNWNHPGDFTPRLSSH